MKRERSRRNSMKGQHYPIRVWNGATPTRSKFLTVQRAVNKALALALEARLGTSFTVIRVRSGKALFVAKRNALGVTGVWHK